jgi:Bacterial TSP3 repeat
VPAFADNGNDGIPDQWMQTHFSHIDPRASDRSQAGDDADGDGLTNFQEFKAGTDPKDPKSVFRIKSIAKASGADQIAFDSVLGKTYRLEYRDDWLLGSWLTMEDQISGTGASVQIDPSAAGVTKRFYRLSIEP